MQQHLKNGGEHLLHGANVFRRWRKKKSTFEVPTHPKRCHI